MTKSFLLIFENGLPKGTAQQKGEAIRYKNGAPYIQHYRKDKVNAMRQEFIYKLKKHAPRNPAAGAVGLTVIFCFDVKNPKLWGQYKTTRPDADNIIKELKDAMTACSFWNDDSQVAHLEVIKKYAKTGIIAIRVEDLEDLEDGGAV